MEVGDRDEGEGEGEGEEESHCCLNAEGARFRLKFLVENQDGKLENVAGLISDFTLPSHHTAFISDPKLRTRPDTSPKTVITTNAS